MTANKNSLSAILAAFVLCMLFSSCGDRRGREVRHGQLTFSVTDVFPEHSESLGLALAASRGDHAKIKRSLTNGAKINLPGKYGITPLWWAAWAENFDGFSALLENGANPNASGPEKLPVMHLVTQLNEARFLQAALKHGGNPDALDKLNGNTLLVRAVLLGRHEHFEVLLLAGANINARERVSGRSLPMIAIDAGNDYELVFRLLKLGSDYLAKDNRGNSLADVLAHSSIARSSVSDIWRVKVMDYLNERGVKVPSRPQKGK